MVKLKPIDLEKINGCEHPDISLEWYYLAKIHGRWYAGRFSRQHYGLNFQAVYGAGYQLSWDGWEQLYEIVDHEINTIPFVFNVLKEAIACEL